MRIKVVYDRHHPQLQDCPLGCIRQGCRSGIIVINPDLFYSMNEFDQKFWLLHEEGHIYHDTDSEFLADQYAFNQLAGSEHRSLKKMVQALNSLLQGNNPEFENRKKQLYKMALRWDKEN